VKSIGVKLVRLLRDVLWYIDGHHHVFQQRSSPLQAEFGYFTNYNNPELSKHRKRRTSNLSADALEQFLLDLSVVLNENYWERDGWCDMKLLIISLSSSISGYIDYLRSKNKRMLLCDRSPTPVRELSEHLRIRFLNQSSLATNELLQPIESAMENLSFFEQINITSLLPSSDLVKKHRVLEILTKTGLSLSAVLLTYSPGSNIGNMHFMWKVPDDDPVDALERSQPVIEDIKKDIPVYHSRLMRSTMYNKFGRVAPTVKPAVLRYFYKSLTGDQTSSDTTDQAEIDARVSQIIDMEDPEVVLDLCSLNTDYLCAGRTAPYHSWRNPVERIMSVLNLGLQYVALARLEMPEEYEHEANKCNTLTELRKIAKRKEEFKSAVKDSLSSVKVLLSDIIYFHVCHTKTIVSMYFSLHLMKR
jgi:hypothetical protein